MPALNADTSSGKFRGTVCGTYEPNPNSVIYIVDSVRYTAKKFSRISPEDIENLQVLKGEAAAKLYGPSAALVISITTKRKSGYIVVRDGEDKEPLASASLVFNENYRKVPRIAGEDGRVDTKNMTHGKMQVEVSCIGYKTKTVLLDISKKSIHHVEMEKDHDTLEQVVVTTEGGRRVWCGWRISYERVMGPPASPSSVYLKVFPNPAKSNSAIYLQLPSQENPSRAELLNVSGQLIKTINLQPSKTASHRFDLPQLSAGMYHVRVTDAGSGKSHVANLVVE